jgi:hypothetical protein
MARTRSAPRKAKGTAAHYRKLRGVGRGLTSGVRQEADRTDGL